MLTTCDQMESISSSSNISASLGSAILTSSSLVSTTETVESDSGDM